MKFYINQITSLHLHFILISFSHNVLTIMFVSHLLATRKIKADQGAQTNEGRKIDDKEDIFCHGL